MATSLPDSTSYPADFHLTPTGAFSFGGTLGVLMVSLACMLIATYRHWRRNNVGPLVEPPEKSSTCCGTTTMYPWYSINGLLERLFGPLNWCEARYQAVDKVCECSNCKKSDKEYEKGCENIFKLIETIKIVVVFLMVLTPDTMTQYTCALPKELIGQADQSFFAPSTMFPCQSSENGEDFFNDYYQGRHTSDFSTAAIKYVSSASNVICGRGAFLYFAGVLFVEAMTLIWVLMVGLEVFRSPRFHAAMFIVTSLLWSFWPNLLAFRYYVNDKEDFYLCYVPYTVLTTAVFSLWHTLIVVLLFLTHYANKRVPKPLTQKYSADPNFSTHPKGRSSEPQLAMQPADKVVLSAKPARRSNEQDRPVKTLQNNFTSENTASSTNLIESDTGRRRAPLPPPPTSYDGFDEPRRNAY